MLKPQVPTSVRLDRGLLASVDEACEAFDRDRTWVIRDALKLYVRVHADEIKQRLTEVRQQAS